MNSMDFLNGLSILIGYAVIGVIILAAITTIISMIGMKIKDIKDKKTTIKEGTVLYKDGRKFVIKKDLNIRFESVKGMSCKCDELGEHSWIKGISFPKSKMITLGNFERELMDNCILVPNKMRKIIEEQK